MYSELGEVWEADGSICSAHNVTYSHRVDDPGVLRVLLPPKRWALREYLHRHEGTRASTAKRPEYRQHLC